MGVDTSDNCETSNIGVAVHETGLASSNRVEGDETAREKTSIMASDTRLAWKLDWNTGAGSRPDQFLPPLWISRGCTNATRHVAWNDGTGCFAVPSSCATETGAPPSDLSELQQIN